MWWIVGAVGFILILFIIYLACCSKRPVHRSETDEAQIEYMNQWAKEHPEAIRRWKAKQERRKKRKKKIDFFSQAGVDTKPSQR